ncbi:MAG: hypothetical protein ACKVRP_00865 [Bacteroidota bacterium]
MKRTIVFCLFLGTVLSVSDASADSYSVQFVEIGNDGNNLDVKVQIKANGSAFKLGTTNLAFSYGSGLNAPTLQSSHNFGDGVMYAPLIVTAPSGSVGSLNIEYLGSLDSGTTVPARFIDIATIRFPIANANESFLLVNRTFGGLPRSVVFASNENEVVDQSTDVRTAVRVMLEGPFNVAQSRMNKTLNTSGHLATRYPGANIPADAVDSIAIEMRSASSGTGSSFRSYRSAWLLADGTIRAFADTTQRYVDFDTTDASAYIVVRHANHLPIMTSNAISWSAFTTLSHDFVGTAGGAWGTNATKQVSSGVYAMYAGDGNQSGVVTAADANDAFAVINSTGYNIRDVNMSGVVTAADANMAFGNLNKSNQVPE